MNSDPGHRNRFPRLWKAYGRPLEHHQVQHLLRRFWKGTRVVWNGTVELLLRKPRPKFQRPSSPRHCIVASSCYYLFYRQETLGPYEGGPRTF